MKKKFTFQVGDRVGEFTSSYYEDDFSDPEKVELMYDENNSPRFGQVIAILLNQEVKVKWDNDWHEDISTENIEDLAPEDVVRKRYSVLEAEFKAVAKRIKAKLKKVADELLEANEMAEEELGRNLNQLRMGYGDFYNAMDTAGWRTSSFGC